MQMIEFLNYHVIPFTIVLTKADKLSKMQLSKHVKGIAADLYLGEGNLIATSAETAYGKDKVLEKIAHVIDLFQSGALQDEGEQEETDI